MAIKLTDTQRVILSHAATRETLRLLPVPKSLHKNPGGIALSVKPLIAKGLVSEVPWTSDDVVWADVEGQGKTTLIVSRTGLAAIGVDVGAPPPATEPESRRRKTDAVVAAAPSAWAPNPPKAGTKLATLIDLLNRKDGATIPEMMDATGWQAHSVRGGLSGALKKKLKLDVRSADEGARGRVYRIAKQIKAVSKRSGGQSK